MPTALATSKRKFHALLNSITRPSSSRSNSTSDPPVSKRPRLSPRSSIVSSHPLSPSPSHLRTLDRDNTPEAPHHDSNNPRPYLEYSTYGGVRVSARTKAVMEQRAREKQQKLAEEAQYNPWSRPGFLKRLRTFNDLTHWTPGKPDEINEVAWAKRGWTLDEGGGINRVACKKGCEQRAVVTLRPPRKDEEGKEIPGTEDWDQDVSDELVKRFESLIVEGHDEDCSWRTERGCGPEVVRVGIVREVEWQRELKARYRSLCELGASNLPALDRTEIPPKLDLWQTRRYLEDGFFRDTRPVLGTEPTTYQINEPALLLALAGWEASLESSSAKNTPTAVCTTCFRRVGLWLYTKELVKGREEDSPKFDLIDNHRHYCPWINAETQCMSEGPFQGLPAYDILQRVIGNWAGVRARARKSGLRIGLDGQDSKNQVNGDDKTERDDAEESEADKEGRPSSEKSREELLEEDNRRFARLREIKRRMGLDRVKRDRPAATGRT